MKPQTPNPKPQRNPKLQTPRTILRLGRFWGLGVWGFFGVWGLVLGVFLLSSVTLCAAPLDAAFEQANKLYEESKHAEAAAAYEKMIDRNRPSATLWFNLGNARYKAGQAGLAIAAYRQAEALGPRDPNVRFNLEFVRKKVIGSDTLPAASWRQRLNALTLNEWSVLAMAAWWLTWLLLALGEARPAWRKPLRLWTGAAGGAALLLGGCLITAAQEQRKHDEGVVVVPEAVVRYGPLEESQVYYQLRDGAEVVVLDEKKARDQPAWVQVRDAARRIGWLKRNQLVVL